MRCALCGRSPDVIHKSPVCFFSPTFIECLSQISWKSAKFYALLIHLLLVYLCKNQVRDFAMRIFTDFLGLPSRFCPIVKLPANKIAGTPKVKHNGKEFCGKTMLWQLHFPSAGSCTQSCFVELELYSAWKSHLRQEKVHGTKQGGANLKPRADTWGIDQGGRCYWNGITWVYFYRNILYLPDRGNRSVRKRRLSNKHQHQPAPVSYS